MRINLYLASEMEYKRGLAHILLSRGVVDTCLVNALPWTDCPKHDHIVRIDHSPSLFAEYDEVCNINDLPAVSKDLMEMMLPYESTAIKMGMRRLDYPTAEYEEEKRKYLQHLRYWDYMLRKYEINLIIMSTYPHSPGSYVMYGLARIKKIPFLMWQQQDTFLNRCVWGESIEDIGMSIARRFESLAEEDISEDVLNDDIKNDYKRATKIPDRMEVTSFNRKKNRKANAYREKQVKDRIKEYRRRLFRLVAKSILKTGSLDLYEKKAIWFRTWRRSFTAYKYYKHFNEITVDEYDRKLAVDADITQKYILFLLQFQPEASTLPQAGVFAEQYNSIQLLARAAKKVGAFVYVKEHPHNHGRHRDFYDEIRFIDNVKLIRSYELTYDLMKHSIGISTQTGTCIWEAVGMKKPVFVFSSGYFWKGCPGVFEIVDEDQGASVIRSAINGVDITDDNIQKYLYAIQMETISEITPWEMNEYAENPSVNAPMIDMDDRIKLINSFIKEKCHEL